MRERMGRGVVMMVMSAGAALAFEPPAREEVQRALGSLEEERLAVRRLLTPDEDFAPIRRPEAGDWLAAHEEKGQSFAEFLASGANRPDAARSIVYLLPLGEFDDAAAPSLEELRAYAAAFFQLDVEIPPAAPLAGNKFQPRLNPGTKQRQILSTAVLNHLRERLPEDAFCLLGVTMADLYPWPSWNFVFGQASLNNRVGVFSFARYDPAFFGEERPADYHKVILQRSAKVLAHEISHMFGMSHCIYFECVLNGSNHQAESDRQPPHLCPVCLRKLRYGAGFDLIRRYQALADFYERAEWDAEAAWVGRQLDKARTPRPAPIAPVATAPVRNAPVVLETARPPTDMVRRLETRAHELRVRAEYVMGSAGPAVSDMRPAIDELRTALREIEGQLIWAKTATSGETAARAVQDLEQSLAYAERLCAELSTQLQRERTRSIE